MDVIVWPETMFCHQAGELRGEDWPNKRPGRRRRRNCRRLGRGEPRVSRQNGGHRGKLGTALFLGSRSRHHTAGTIKYFNSLAHVSSRGELLGLYDKTFLLMFGEYLPLASVSLAEPSPAAQPGAKCGRSSRGIHGEATLRSTSICYEVLSADVIRWQVNVLAQSGRKPDVLVNVANVNWFRGSSELEMHLACAVFRAVDAARQ